MECHYLHVVKLMAANIATNKINAPTINNGDETTSYAKIIKLLTSLKKKLSSIKIKSFTPLNANFAKFKKTSVIL